MEAPSTEGHRIPTAGAGSGIRTSAPRCLPLIGKTLGKYRVDKYLGGGGMADVYEAVTTGPSGFRKRVAIKVVNERFDGFPDFEDLLMAEGWMTAQVQHPNVCQALDADVSEGTAYVVLEHLDGVSLKDILVAFGGRRDEHFDHRHLAISAKVVADLLLGLHAAHLATDLDGRWMGIVHQDVSPDNVFICRRSGAVKLLDFGVATSVLRPRPPRLSLGGKVAYSAPERLAGGRPVDHRADLWSAGVVLWELLTARRLFKHDGGDQTSRDVAASTVPPPSSVRPRLPPLVERIVDRALSQDPSRRFATGQEMSDALSAKAMLHGRAITSADVAEWASAALAPR